jgi:hypothetical protein
VTGGSVGYAATNGVVSGPGKSVEPRGAVRMAVARTVVAALFPTSDAAHDTSVASVIQVMAKVTTRTRRT